MLVSLLPSPQNVTQNDCVNKLCTLGCRCTTELLLVDLTRNVMAHAQKPELGFLRNGRVHLNRRGGSVQSTAGSRGVRISGSNGSNAGYTVF